MQSTIVCLRKAGLFQMSDGVVSGPRRLWVALEAMYSKGVDDDVDEGRRRRARPVAAPSG